MMARPSVVLPEPLSPTRPKALPSAMDSDTSATASIIGSAMPARRALSGERARKRTRSRSISRSSAIGEAMAARPMARRDDGGSGRLAAAALEDDRTARGEDTAGADMGEVGQAAGDGREERRVRWKLRRVAGEK